MGLSFDLKIANFRVLIGTDLWCSTSADYDLSTHTHAHHARRSAHTHPLAYPRTTPPSPRVLSAPAPPGGPRAWARARMGMGLVSGERGAGIGTGRNQHIRSTIRSSDTEC